MRGPVPAGVRRIVVRFPAGTDEEKTFQTFRNYLQAVCNWTTDMYPHAAGPLYGVAVAVKAKPWRARVPARSKILTSHAGEVLRISWATEILLNSPRVFGADDLIGYANLWAPVQAYYSIFHALHAIVMTEAGDRSPATHEGLLRWACNQVAHPATPFVVPWTARVSGPPTAFRYEGFGSVTPNSTINNSSAPTVANAPHLVAVALRATRRDQIEEKRQKWAEAIPTNSGTKRKNLPTRVLLVPRFIMSGR